MVVELLTFTVPVEEQEAWFAADERHWTTFLERQDGFVRKEVWRSTDDPSEVHAVIWWRSLADWKAIPQADLDAVIAAMGALERQASCTAFDVVRSAPSDPVS